MKYRQCKSIDNFDLNPDTIPPRDKNKWTTKTYQVEVITPIYGGGVKAGEPDKDMPIRASAIRGQLRYWWRFLAMNREDKPLQGEDLFKEERRIWGGMTDNPDEDGSSKVFVQVKMISNNLSKSIQPCGHYETLTNKNTGKTSFPFKFDNNIPPYSLFPAQGKPPIGKGQPPQENPHTVILPPLTFKLTIRINISDCDNDQQIVYDAVTWWLNFGGIGARTRRGLGSIYSKDAKILNAEDVGIYSCNLEQITAQNANDAWNKAIIKLQQFRQGRGFGREQGHGNRPGRSFWPEPDSIREITDKPGHPIEHEARQSFPRAAFGLPIIFEIRGNGEPPKTELAPCDSERMSSPLILKARKLADNKHCATALLLPYKRIQDKLSVSLEYINLEKDIQNRHEQNRLRTKLPKSFHHETSNSAPHWWDSTKAEHVKPINDNKGNNNTTNALDAFMNFFAKGGK